MKQLDIQQINEVKGGGPAAVAYGVFKVVVWAGVGIAAAAKGYTEAKKAVNDFQDNP